ncbi:MAG: hypothetical protein ACPGQD_01915 [Planctomycetota bacterium]
MTVPQQYEPHARATYELAILDAGTKHPVRQDYLRLIDSVELHQVWDGADALTLNMRGWDEHDADYRVVGERIFAPGAQIIFRAGYGGVLRTLGRFTVVRPQPDFSEQGVTVSIQAYDGFHLLMDDTYPGHYGAPPTYTDVALAIARKRGMGVVADVSKPIPHEKRKRRRRTRRGRKTKTVGTVIVKNAGDTDAKMVKDLANYSGFASPKVRYVETGSPEARALADTHEVVEGLTDRDVLFFRQLKLSRQKAEAERYKLTYSRRGGLSTLSKFRPDWDASAVPQAVRVTGFVRKTKQVHVVEASITTDELRRTGATGPTTITGRATRRFSKQEAKDFKKGNVPVAVIEILGDKKPTKAYSPADGGEVQTMRRETLRAMPIVATLEELEGIARGWLELRSDLHITATAVVRDVPGAETFYPFRVYETEGLPAEYEGNYLVKSARHVWSGNGHTVDLQLDKVAEIPPGVVVKGRPKTETPPA